MTSAGSPYEEASPSPNPLDALSPGPFETWEQMAATADGRERAIALGQTHNALMRAAEELGASHGGGLIGIARGLLARAEQQRLIRAIDRQRLMAELDLIHGAVATTATIRCQCSTVCGHSIRR